MLQPGTVAMLKLDEVVFRQDLYPRIETDPATVQRYAEAIDLLPPITVNQHGELIDGWHRWTAHKKVGREAIQAQVVKTGGEQELLWRAIESNATHGLQLSMADKKALARRLYNPDAPDSAEQKRKLSRALSVSERTVRDWLARVDKDAKEARSGRILDAWMACETLEAIGKGEDLSAEAVNKTLQLLADLPKLEKSHRAAAEHASDYDPPLYNVWKFKQKTNEVGHFGNSEPTIVDHLLYLYTDPFDVVVDPFAGSGSTREVCRRRWRRCWVSDREVPVELQGRLREWDITDGLPPLPRWKDVRLVYLDPPYWRQAEGRYSEDPRDLSNMPLERFTETLFAVISGFAGKLPKGAHIALLMQPTQWNAPDHRYTDHVAEMIRSVNLPIEMRVQCPYESEQCMPQMVIWAKENRQILVLSRELVIWRV